MAKYASVLFKSLFATLPLDDNMKYESYFQKKIRHTFTLLSVHTLLFVWKIYQGSVSPSCNKKKATNHKICQLFRIVTLSFFQNKCNKILLQAGDVELFSFYVRVAQVEISGSTFCERSCQSNFVGSLVNALKAGISDKKITESLKIEK